MPLDGDKAARGRRVQEIQASTDAMDFCNQLNAAARELGFDASWSPSRLSKVRNGTQDLSIDDATVLARFDPKGRGWSWIAYGVAVKGEDAWTVLARAKKSKTG